ncbi:hypothetical protein DN752_00620 [Echinicola strongylocentroti]|uniref:Fibrobacter succinogenes major paralogous domain-containing protein n=1 Tax=Echinicola strongylocentroti TaxID=1795355 RepID=A0A2Z4IDA6_9BACT|nr:fibrobacter succinogenes major paralogous domain-containing protein [Echinicola strongylocentroti]AWW28755.1 hypothetical protein DN752_00620 [Echinicola strongylocentroti]
MKSLIFLSSFLLLLMGSCVQENHEKPQMGMLTISDIVLQDFGNYALNSRMSEVSEWKHIFPESATLLITNKATGQEYTLEYNPNDFTESYQIQLPFGKYIVYSEVEGRELEAFLPFVVTGEFALDNTSLDISLQANTEYGLVTVAKSPLILGAELGGDYGLFDLKDSPFLYSYSKERQTRLIISLVDNEFYKEIGKGLTIDAYNHYHFYLKETESQGMVNFIELAIGPFEYHEEYFDVGEKPLLTVTDEGGRTYDVVKIGDQYWMAENLMSTTFCNGDELESMSWGVIPPYYASSVLSESRNICPCDWHIPTDEDWQTLESYLGLPDNELYALNTERGRGTSTGYILHSDYIGLALEYSGYMNWDQRFQTGQAGYFWSASFDEMGAVDSLLVRNIDGGSGIWRSSVESSYAVPIRCVKD